jgi:plasmid replication initiation protein
MARKTKRNQGIVIIKKSNQLIESRYKFDVWETRVFLSVLANIRREDEDFKVYRIWYRDVIKVFGLKSAQSYGLLREAARGLMRKVFNVTNTERGFQRETEYHIIRSINYLSDKEDTRGAGESQEYIDLTIDPEMKPLLLQLQKNFTAYDLRNVVKLGAYPVRVYELLKQYETIGERTLDIDEMKRMFELTTEYPLFANFYQKIIEPAIRDINEHTDLNITNLEKVKEGRKVVALRFRFVGKSSEELRVLRGEAISPVKQTSMEFVFPEKTANNPSESARKIATESDNASKNSLKDELFIRFQPIVVTEFGVTPTAFLQLLDNKTEDEINIGIRVTRRAKASGQIDRNLAGFFMEAVRQGFTDTTEENARKKAENDARRTEIQNTLEQLRDEQATQLSARIRELTASKPTLTDEAIADLRTQKVSKKMIEAREKELGHPLDVQDFREDRTLREMVKTRIFELHRADFVDVLSDFEGRIGDLMRQLKQL